MPTITITPTGSTWKAIVTHAAGTDAYYHLPTREAAERMAAHMAANAPVAPEPTGRQRIVRLVPVGRSAR